MELLRRTGGLLAPPPPLEEDARGTRVEQNEVAFRALRDDALWCECGRLSCRTRVPVPRSEYAWLRDFAGRYLLAAGHERPHQERIVDRGRGWVVVESPGPPGAARSAADLV